MFKTIQMFFLLFSCLNMAFLLYLQRVINSHGANIQKISHIMMISNKNFKKYGF